MVSVPCDGLQGPDQEMSAEGNGAHRPQDDDDKSDFDIDETDLESFSTVLEMSDDIDEFQIFCISLQRKSFDARRRETSSVCLLM